MHVLIMPRQGNTVESCVIVGVKVKEGDKVTEETVLCEVETDKATFEVPAGAAGTVLKLLRAEGDDVPVLEPIAVIGNAGDDWASALGSATTTATAKTAVIGESVQASAIAEPRTTQMTRTAPITIDLSSSTSFASPRARNLAASEGLSLVGISGTGPDSRIIERDVRAALQNRAPLTAAAKASANGAVPAFGSGIGGRVTAADLNLCGTDAAPEQSRSLLPQTASSGTGQVTETPIKGIRKLIADRMYQSLAESAQFTLSMSASAVRIQEIRKRMKATDESLALTKITVNDLILFAVSRVLPQFSFMNAHKVGDTLRTFERVHLGVAVDTPKGLMVPVIRNANLLSLPQISSEAKRLAAAAQGGAINPDELTGSTFTVTNLGSLGVTSFTPVLNAPEVGILGVCGIELKPVQKENTDTEDCCSVAFEPHIGFSLTINHQVVDGAPAARFLKALGDAVANIDLWLARG